MKPARQTGVRSSRLGNGQGTPMARGQVVVRATWLYMVPEVARNQQAPGQPALSMQTPRAPFEVHKAQQVSELS